MKQLSSFMVLNIGGGDRISFTFDEINAETGEPMNRNVKQSFYIVDSELLEHVNAIRDYIREKKLSEE